MVSLIRVVNGSVGKGDKIRVLSTGRDFQVDAVGTFSPKRTERARLECGEVGYLVAGIKDIHGAPVGDTLTLAVRPCAARLPGFKRMQPRVFAGLFPISSDDFEDMREALEKLSLNDAALQFEPENSGALGFGFRCGFLGMLHMEIVQERLEREYDIDLITTAPTVVYQVVMLDGDVLEVDNPADLPDSGEIDRIEEPVIHARILLPQEFIGAVMQLCIEKRGVQKRLTYHGRQVTMAFELPMAEVVVDFFDRLKSVSRGYASFEYEFERFEPAALVRLDVLINGDRVDALSSIVHRDMAYGRGRDYAERLADIIPRQMFDVAIQAAIGSRVLARSTVKALRKNVTAKCYGGDVSRKRKLLEKQKAGKKRMKQFGKIEIPQEAFLTMLSTDGD